MKKNVNAKINLLEHSQAKLALYERYLKKYLAILGVTRWISKINIYDIFCGTGVYQNNKIGSPIIAVNCVKEIQDFLKKISTQRKKVVITINDGNPENVSNVKNVLENEISNCELRFFNSDAKEMFERVITDIKKQEATERNLLFIDPYGYKEIHKDDLYALLANEKTEILLFLPISFMYRFKRVAVTDFDNPAYEQLRRFIYDFFEADHPIRMGADIDVFHFIDHLKNALSFGNKFFSTFHYIQRNRGNYFALFFITHSILGYEKILEAKWELDEAEGRGFMLPQKQMSLFAEEDIDRQRIIAKQKLEKLVLQYLAKTNDKTNVDLYGFVLRNEFLPKHCNEILRELQNEGRLSVLSIKTKKLARKGAFYISYNDSKAKPKVTFKVSKKWENQK